MYWGECLKGKIGKDENNMSVVSRDEGAFGRCSFLPKTPEENEQALSVR